MKLKLTKNRKPVGGNVTTQRRMKLINNIERQLHSFTDNTVKVNKWYWLGEDGCYYFEVKYGKQPMNLLEDPKVNRKRKLEYSENQVRQVYRWIKTAETVIENVSKGEFPGKVTIR